MNKVIPALVLSMATVTAAQANFNPYYPGAPGFNSNFWHDIDRQFKEFDSRMRHMQRNSNSGFGTQSRRYIDTENNHYVIEILVSGLDKDDLEIVARDGQISIRGKRVIEQQVGNNRAKSSSSFSQSFSLPNDADGDQVSAKFEDGKLVVSIPKLAAPKPTERVIEIN